MAASTPNGDGGSLSVVLSIGATVISVATFLYTVFIKPRRDLRHGSLARRHERHEDAVVEMQRLLAVEASQVEWAVRQITLEGGIDPQGLTIDERIEQMKQVERKVNALRVDLMSPRLTRAFSDFAYAVEALINPLEQVRAGSPLNQWERDLLGATLNTRVPEARIKLEQALEYPGPERNPPLLRISLETRSQVRRRAAKDLEPPMGC